MVNGSYTIEDAKRARDAVAEVMLSDPAVRPVFARLERVVRDLKEGDELTRRAEFRVRRKDDMATFI